MTGDGGTATLTGVAAPDAGAGRAAQLFVAFDCDRPAAPSSRHLLGGLGRVDRREPAIK